MRAEKMNWITNQAPREQLWVTEHPRGWNPWAGHGQSEVRRRWVRFLRGQTDYSKQQRPLSASQWKSQRRQCQGEDTHLSEGNVKKDFNCSKAPAEKMNVSDVQRILIPETDAFLWSSTGSSEGPAQPAKGARKLKLPEMGCLSFLLSISDKNSEIFYSKRIIWVRTMQVSTRDVSLSLGSPNTRQAPASRADGLRYSQAPRLLLLFSRGRKTPFPRQNPSHLFPSESETASETLSCN